MRRLLIACAFVALTGCQTSMIDANVVDGLATPILARHNAYVQADQTIVDETIRADYLRSAELLRALIEEAKGK